MHLTKHHGLGNDFLVALSRGNDNLVPDAAAAVALCQRHRGVGADGLIYGLPGHDGAAVTMVLLNADGSEAEISGNGIRCLAQAVVRDRQLEPGSLLVDTAAGRRRLVVCGTADPCTHMVQVDMGVVDSGPVVPDVLGVEPEHAEGADIGNPHIVLHMASLDGLDPAEIGQLVEAQVPGGVNVHLLATEGDDSIRLLHWERGAGVTEACGSGASVSALLARRWGLVGDTVRVRMPGGDAEVRLGPTDADPVLLVGPTTFVAEVVTP